MDTPHKPHMIKMSSISAQGVVERASAELSKRINGLGLRSKSQSHQNNSSSGSATANSNNNSNSSMTTGVPGTVSTSGSSGKTSVMERVTNALCGGGNNHSHQQQQNNNNTSVGGGGGVGQMNAPEKPSRLGSSGGAGSGGKSNLSTLLNSKSGAATGNLQLIASSTPQSIRKHHGQSNLPAPPLPTTMQQLMLDDRFLNQFFLYFSPLDRCSLAQVCTKWHDVLYRSPRYWSGLVPVIQTRELRLSVNQDRIKLYNSLIRRGFHSISLLGATDEDALDIVHSFPLASKHIHSLSLRCSSVSDRGLEALLDHLQVSDINGMDLMEGPLWR